MDNEVLNMTSQMSIVDDSVIEKPESNREVDHRRQLGSGDK